MTDGEGESRGADPADPDARAARRGKRAGLLVILVVAVAFIGSSTSQITEGVFGLGVTPIPDGPPGSPVHVCATGIRGLALAIDRAGRQLGPRRSTDDAENDAETVAALRPGLSPEWDGAEAVATACSAFPEGTLAWASLQRLRVAAEQSSRLRPGDLGLVRSDVSAHLPADLR